MPLPRDEPTSRRLFRDSDGTVLGLFAGIGGLELGLAKSGRSAALLCEVDPTAQGVLAARFPEAMLANDVRRLAIDDIPRSVDTISAGFPCQDLSQAGRTAGIGGTRSGLVSHVFRLAKPSRIRHLLLENVPFMLKLDQGRAMRWLVDRLEQAGFDWAYRVVDSRAFGLAQRRRRVFLVASRDFDPAASLFRMDRGPDPKLLERPADLAGFYWTEGNAGIGWTENAVPALKVGSGFSIPSPPAIWRRFDDRILTPGIRDAEALQGFPRNWTRPAEPIGGTRSRWRLVGNAVSVDAARWAASCLDAPDSDVVVDDSSFPTAGGCPNAAFGGPRRRAKVVDVSEFPCRRSFNLAATLREPAELSARATRGFHGRYERSSLKRRPEFLTALQQHIERMDELSVTT